MLPSPPLSFPGTNTGPRANGGFLTAFVATNLDKDVVNVKADTTFGSRAVVRGGPRPGAAQGTTPRSRLAASRGKLAELVGLDLRSLAAFRIGLGAILLLDLVGRAGDLVAHYTDHGVLPRSAITNSWKLSLHMLDGTADFQGALFVVAGLAALALLVGWHTRLATGASWFLLLSLHARNPMVLQGGDCLLRLLLFWGMFLPLGARASADRLLRRGGGPPGNRVASAGAAALLLQVCFVYWFAAALKSDPAWRSEGTAVYYALSLDQFATPLGKYLLGFPGLLRGLTFATLGLEVFGPALLFVPLRNGPVRTAVVTGFLLFHLAGLGLCLELGLFPWVCAVAWSALLPGWFWDRVAGRIPLARRIANSLVVPPGCAPAAKSGGPTPRLANALAVAFLVYVFLWNVRTTDFPRWSKVLPPRSDFIAATFGLGQTWDMFAPYPLKDSGWYVVQGSLRDGSRVDLVRDGAPVNWDKPALVSATFKNDRWRKYLINLWAKANVAHRPLYARHLLGEWNSWNSGGRELECVEVYFMLERTRPDYQAAAPQRLLLWQERGADLDPLVVGTGP